MFSVGVEGPPAATGAAGCIEINLYARWLLLICPLSGPSEGGRSYCSAPWPVSPSESMEKCVKLGMSHSGCSCDTMPSHLIYVLTGSWQVSEFTISNDLTSQGYK